MCAMLTASINHFEIHSSVWFAWIAKSRTICCQNTLSLSMTDFHNCASCMRTRASCVILFFFLENSTKRENKKKI
jgi:hypothetical protein